MNQLKLETLCAGIIAVRSNAAELLTDAKILLDAKRFNRAYALAYTACEELGKITILVGAATDVVLKSKVDWKRLRQRFFSHDSKAIQFVGVDIFMNHLTRSGEVSAQEDPLEMLVASFSSSKGILATRNSSLYAEFDGKSFVVPHEKFDQQMVDTMLGVAERQIFIAEKALGETAESVAASIRRNAGRGRREAVGSRLSELLKKAHPKEKSPGD